MATTPTEIDPSTIVYTDGNGNVIKSDGSSGGSGWLSGVLGAIPGILSALFPSGIGGNNNQQYPYVSTLPSGQQQVTLAGGNNNILMIALVAMVAYLVFTGKQPVKAKR